MLDEQRGEPAASLTGPSEAQADRPNAPQPAEVARPIATTGRADGPTGERPEPDNTGAGNPSTARHRNGPAAMANADGDVRKLVEELETSREQVRRQGVELKEMRALVDDERARYRELFEVVREGHIITDLAGSIRESNRGALALLNVSGDYVTGKPLAIYVAVGERREFRIRIYRARTGTDDQEWTTRLEHHDLRPTNVNVTLSPVTDESGNVLALRFVLRDVSSRHTDVVASRQPAAVFRSALDALSAHIAVLDSDGRIVTANRAWNEARLPGGLFQSSATAGANYLELCEQAIAGGNDSAVIAREAVTSVLDGVRQRHEAMYCVMPDGSALGNGDPAWFSLRATRCEGMDPLQVVVTHEDITAEKRSLARERLLLEERAARSAAEAASQAKSEFLTTLSHELRTPLNAIAGYAQLLEMGVRGPVTLEQAEDLRRILRSERHLLGLINELLNFSRVERGDVRLDVEPVSIVSVIDSVLELVEPQAASLRLQLTVHCDRANIEALADPEKLRQILVNLLSNSLKFTHPGGTIRIECDEDEVFAYIRVRDTGVGIPAAKLGEIFDPFVQVHRTLGAPVDGIGLGLAISRNLARAMHGELSATSEIGRGSSFELRLPRVNAFTDVP